MAENEGKRGLHYFILIIFVSSNSISNSKKLLGAIKNVTKAPISIIFLGRRVAELDGLYNIINANKNSFPVGSTSINSDFVEVFILRENFISKIIHFAYPS